MHLSHGKKKKKMHYEERGKENWDGLIVPVKKIIRGREGWQACKRGHPLPPSAMLPLFRLSCSVPCLHSMSCISTYNANLCIFCILFSQNCSILYLSLTFLHFLFFFGVPYYFLSCPVLPAMHS